jgi:hypothetical protein
MEFPSLPDGYFFRIESLLGAPVLRIMKRSWLTSRSVQLGWIDDESPQALFELAVRLKESFLAEQETSEFIEKYSGDYPPRSLSDIASSTS